LYHNNTVMKKTLLIGMIALSGLMAKAQTAFFESVPYKGAFAPQPATPWTAGWANFDPQNAVYPATTVTVPGGDITSNTTWTANNVYLLDDGYVYVTNGATLTIEPGTVIRGQGKGTLIICRGAKINAQGTAANPIVFTSNQAVGARDYGDWGGIVMLGSARHNISTGPDAPAEGGIAKPLPSGDGRHGGTNDDDNSGVLSFVRIEFCGIPLTTASNSEINGLTMYSLGNQTKIDHIQISYSGDDAFEWFGGTVDCKYLVAYKTWDDDFDTDNGYRGRVQFGVAFRDSQYADQSGSCAFESDNDNNGSDNVPVTAPIFSNMTAIGPNWTGNPAATNSLFTRSIHHRRNSRLSVFNSIVTGWPTGYTIDRRKVTANLCTNLSDFEQNIVAGMTTNLALATSSDTLCITDVTSASLFFASAPQNTTLLATSNEVNLVNPFGNTNTNPDFRPATGSPALTGALFTNSKLLPLAALPTLTTAAVTGVTGVAAQTGGNISSDGNLPVTQRGVTWSTSPNPTLGANSTSDGTGTGSFTSNITGLTPATQYYVRAYAVNAVGVAYGNEVTFTTITLAVPTLTTAAVTGITGTNAESGGNITADGNLPVTQRGITWGTSANPTIDVNEFTNNGTGTGSFTSSLTGLVPLTQYYVRAYAVNSFGVGYGNQETFTTTNLSLSENSLDAFVIVYPNPAEEVINISLSSEIEGMMNMQIIDLNGKVVLSRNEMNISGGNNTYQIPVNALAAGIYTLRLIAANGVAVQKLVIR
jgi:hypothetical protein